MNIQKNTIEMVYVGTVDFKKQNKTRSLCAVIAALLTIGCSSGSNHSSNDDITTVVDVMGAERTTLTPASNPIETDAALSSIDNSIVINSDSTSEIDRTTLSPDQDSGEEVADNTDANASALLAIEHTASDTPQSKPMINAENYKKILTQAFDVYSGRAFNTRLNNSKYAKSLDPIHCSSGTFERRENGQIYNNCMLDDELINGSLYRNLVFNSSNLIFTDFTSNQNDNIQMRVDGQYTRKCCSSSVEFHTLNLDYDFNYPGGHLVVSDASTYKSVSSTASIMGGTFYMRPPFMDGYGINVKTKSEFSAPLDKPWGYETGKLELIAEDGSSMLLDASNSVPTTFNVSITNAAGTQQFIEPWEQYRESIAWSQPVEFQLLHYSAGSILNLLAGDGLDTMAITAKYAIEQAVASAALTRVSDAVDTVADPDDVVPTLITTQETHYECNGGGYIDLIVIDKSKIESDGFFNLQETSLETAYQMSNCHFLNPDSDGHRLTLNGRYTNEAASRSGRKHSSSTDSVYFDSLSIVSERDVEGTVEYFADAQVTTSVFNNDGETGDSRVVNIDEYEKISAKGISDLVASVEFSQNRINKTYTGKNTVTMTAKGRYVGRHSDHYPVEIDTKNDFDFTMFTHDILSGDFDVAPNGQFSMHSENGDSLSIVIQPSASLDQYYLANFISDLSDGENITLEDNPFYRYQTTWSRFSR